MPLDRAETAEDRRRSREALSGPNNVGSEVARALPTTDASTLTEATLRPREWWWQDWIPLGEVGVLSGPGGTGKSYLALMLAVCSAVGYSLAGRDVASGVTLYVSCEDNKDEFQRRLAKTLAYLGLTYADLQGNLHIIHRADHIDNVMVRLVDWNVVTTKFYREVCLTAEALRPAMVMFDGLNDIIEVPENNRNFVKAAVGHLRGFAQEIDTTVLALRHPSRAGEASGDGFSGSTAWEGAFRYFLYFSKPERGASERILKNVKANYGPDGIEVPFIWDDEAGLFVVDDPDIGMVAQLRRMSEREVFISAVRSLVEAGQRVTDGARQSPSYFAKVIKRQVPHFRSASTVKIEATMRECFDHAELKMGTIIDKQRHRRESIVPADWVDPE
ncbi:AAA family ATPase [Thalassobaculum litoreum]|uniref:AAA family ATPase n=1 Tax=Thalassobaculum litoreum TaxID=420996 RepID=UPI0015874313|nr:AAA family ATPase [Thalassobaculum litoreum]